MAQMIGKTGASSRTLAADRQRKRWWVVGTAIAFLVYLLIIVCVNIPRVGNQNSVVSLVGSIVVFIVALYAMTWLERAVGKADDHLRKRKRDAERGAKGEDLVGEQLATLPDEYWVFNDLTRLAGDIDHIVIGPTGIFVIETKAHGGTVSAEGDRVLVNGRPPEKDFINQSWRNAYWLRDVLKNVGEIEVDVRPILVFANAFVKVRQPVKGVRVINKGYLVKTILKAPPSNVPVDRVVAILRTKAGVGAAPTA